MEKKTTKEKVHTVLHCLDDDRCMRLQEDLSPALSLGPSNITSSGHEREPVSTSMELEGKEDEEHEYNGDEADEYDTIIAHSPQTSAHSPRRSLPTRNTELHWERVIRAICRVNACKVEKQADNGNGHCQHIGRLRFVIHS